ncbi:DUF3102 domain-containing protein [Desulfosporosinus sp. BG]|uniref:DUF3102 domain-containing protein n=1 Tax=Desulfosporosinus sp. BG TaxID=1633135 RepID=UPI0008581729|nr:DUF3102 domain-containing protein [Desulfosporosinus sp. BG]ODA42987.1 hypothetical protein DSBG_0337 [Desulfosporosinus sp. BG]
MSYTQAIILLGIPEEERESFVAENDVAANQGAVTKITSERDELRKEASGLQAAIHTEESTIKTYRRNWMLPRE